ncbi:major facilitator transporter [Amycolatopsis mediterranei S699]|uniref:Major facilitator transporter n=3 Tax=Amycolatopsis mediterranei TaxID=33910 RepID=A0A0H3DGK0_AMYMU|nr:MFS transporter [Amycolatopsis mediterranei]ADJ49831.1 major facilitator transporter [Amycolatopsis mediterranei U32]AEK46819.1 major facilitator transporter [Amycolatopsis mediterranei S699]AFO81538.1 major facilitator transporter [Amycolatopsis mediterranei S699]AGT88667.1 major facilitator transporter [Amycolatopsis mediterranei RB]KDO07919.1 MFS transporter [Amycolatopsis mediterranei]
MPTTTRYRRRWAALAVLLVAEAMNLLDATIVQVAGPAIHADLPGPAADIPWFSAAYTLPFAAFLITGGRLGDIFGRARTFRIGVAGFVLASLACAAAPDAGLLIGARAVQGAAAALIIPQTIGLIRALFDGAELAKALGTIGPVMGLSAVTGPLLGGLLTQAVSWRAVFLVNVPLGLAVLLAARLLREDRAATRPRLDVTGTLLVAGGAGLLVYPLIDPAGTDWGLLAAGGVLLVVFGFQQRRAAAPLVEPSLFAHRGFPAALAGSLLFFAVMTGLMQVVPMQLQLGSGADVRTAGLTLLPLSAGLAVSSYVAGARLVPKFGSRVMFAGLALLVTGVLAMEAGGVGAYPWALALCGLGMGTFTVPFFTAALDRVRPHETGSAAGLLNAVQQLGGTLGVALLGGLYLGTGTAAAALGLGAALAVAAAVAVVPLTARKKGSAPDLSSRRGP